MRQTTARGITYDSRAEASRALGIHISTLEYHIDRGTVDRAGLRRKTRACDIDGVEYPTLTAAAQATGRTVTSIWRQVEREAARK